MRTLKNVLPVLLGAAAGAVVAVFVASGSNGATKTVTVKTAAAKSVPTTLASTKGLTINQIYRRDSPGVVDIIETSKSSGPFGNTQESTGEGAGVVYDKKGDILTDEHVVNGATSILVNFNNGVHASARVLGTDPSTDMAVIKVNVPKSDLDPIPFANSNKAQVGDPVVAIGSPFQLPETTTAGIVSAVGRSIQAPNKFTISGAIQTDAAINPGNSGGPLIDADGKVLGLNDQIQTNGNADQSAGVGFATPANEDVQVAKEIIAGKKVQHAYVGVSLNPNYTGTGAQIAQNTYGEPPAVIPGGPAAKAGVRPGDVVTAINSNKVTSTDGFIASIGQFKPGQKVTLTVRRGGSDMKIPVTLGNRPRNARSG